MQRARGTMLPSAFISPAEVRGAPVRLGQRRLEEASRTAAAWPEDVHVAVDASPTQLRPSAFPSRVTRVPAETAILSNGDEVAAGLEAIRAPDVLGAMDDFGRDSSCLSSLRRLPVDVITIDRRFAASAEADPRSMAVLRAIIQMGRDVRIATAREGVEMQGQQDPLRKPSTARGEATSPASRAPFDRTGMAGTFCPTPRGVQRGRVHRSGERGAAPPPRPSAIAAPRPISASFSPVVVETRSGTACGPRATSFNPIRR